MCPSRPCWRAAPSGLPPGRSRFRRTWVGARCSTARRWKAGNRAATANGASSPMAACSASGHRARPRRSASSTTGGSAVRPGSTPRPSTGNSICTWSTGFRPAATAACRSATARARTARSTNPTRAARSWRRSRKPPRRTSATRSRSSTTTGRNTRPAASIAWWPPKPAYSAPARGTAWRSNRATPTSACASTGRWWWKAPEKRRGPRPAPSDCNCTIASAPRCSAIFGFGKRHAEIRQLTGDKRRSPVPPLPDQACLLAPARGHAHQDLLAVERDLPVAARRALVTAVRHHAARLDVIHQVLRQDLVADAPHQLLIFHREEQLHAAVEIARHQVGAAQIDFLLAAVAEIEDAAVLQKPPHDAGHPNGLAHPRNSGPQAADPADQQIDPNARLRGTIQTADHFGIHQRVHFENQVAFAVFGMMLDLALDQRLDPLAKVDRRHQQFQVVPLLSLIHISSPRDRT